MTKTPEELAEEYAVITTNNLFYREPLSNAFLAGYKAAKERALRLVDEVQERLSGAYDNGEFMESE